MGLAERRWLRIFTLCALYMAQGIPWGFMATTLPGYLQAQQLDFALVATTMSFTTLPYSFKWIWGPIIDTLQIPRFGRRRPWILLAQAMMAVTVAAMIALDVTTQVRLLAWMVFVHTVFNALQDVATDALSVEILPDNERGSANGLMFGAKYAGGALGGVGMAKLIVWTNLDTALTVQALVLIAIMLVPLLVREREGSPPPREPARVVARELQHVFSLRSPLVAALLALASNFAIGLIAANGVALFVGELGWSYDEYSEITGGWGLVAGGLAAAAAGAVADRIGRRRLIVIAASSIALNWIVFALARPLWSNITYIYVSALFENAMTGAFTVGLITLFMDLSWTPVAGTQFAAFMALTNFSTTLGYQFAATANSLWTYEGIWIAGTCCQLAPLLLLLAIDPTQVRRQLPLPDGTRPAWFGIAGLLALLVFLISMTAYVTSQKLG